MPDQTVEQVETIEYLRRALEHAPQNPGQMGNLLGWWAVPEVYVCAKCAGRILARGCHLPRNAEPVWPGQPVGQCCCEGYGHG